MGILSFILSLPPFLSIYVFPIFSNKIQLIDDFIKKIESSFVICTIIFFVICSCLSGAISLKQITASKEKGISLVIISFVFNALVSLFMGYSLILVIMWRNL